MATAACSNKNIQYNYKHIVQIAFTLKIVVIIMECNTQTIPC